MGVSLYLGKIVMHNMNTHSNILGVNTTLWPSVILKRINDENCKFDLVGVQGQRVKRGVIESTRYPLFCQASQRTHRTLPASRKTEHCCHIYQPLPFLNFSLNTRSLIFMQHFLQNWLGLRKNLGGQKKLARRGKPELSKTDEW